MSQQEVKMKYKIKEERLKFSDGILWNRIYLTFVFQAWNFSSLPEEFQNCGATFNINPSLPPPPHLLVIPFPLFVLVDTLRNISYLVLCNNVLLLAINSYNIDWSNSSLNMLKLHAHTHHVRHLRLRVGILPARGVVKCFSSPPPSKGASGDDTIYERKNPREHVLLRPGEPACLSFVNCALTTASVLTPLLSSPLLWNVFPRHVSRASQPHHCSDLDLQQHRSTHGEAVLDVQSRTREDLWWNSSQCSRQSAARLWNVSNRCGRKVFAEKTSDYLH